MEIKVGNPYPTPTHIKLMNFIGGGIILSIPTVLPSPSETNITVTGTSTYFCNVLLRARIA